MSTKNINHASEVVQRLWKVFFFFSLCIKHQTLISDKSSGKKIAKGQMMKDLEQKKIQATRPHVRGRKFVVLSPFFQIMNNNHHLSAISLHTQSKNHQTRMEKKAELCPSLHCYQWQSYFD